MISYHAYADTPGQLSLLSQLAEFGRPLFCTEWLARHVDSRIEEQLPLFRAQRVSSFHWGLVQGKTQTWLPWPDIPRNETTALLWFHDVLKSYGSAYSEKEMQMVRRLNAAG